jgi:hypothetical protein
MCGLAAQFLSLAEEQGATLPLMMGHRHRRESLTCDNPGQMDAAIFQENL